MNIRCSASLIVLVALTGCAEFKPRSAGDAAFLQRVQSQTESEITVTVAVPTRAEALQIFDTDLQARRIQPIWVGIENNSDNPVWFHPYSLDPDYFSPHEAAWLSHRGGSAEINERIDNYFRAQAMPYFVPAEGRASGFVFASYKFGTRYIPVAVSTHTQSQTFEFFVKDPDALTDYDLVEFNALYAPEQIRELEDEDAVRVWATQLGCCTANASGTRPGDPVNFIVVASEFTLRRALLRGGWDETAAFTAGTAARTALAGLTETAYQNAPFSSLYLFGRRQDIGFQKARQNVHQRNHLRLWLAPVTYRGTPVWAGQISRDIGSRLTSKTVTLTTHKIDPNVDDVRDGLILDLYESKTIDAYGFVAAVGRAAPRAPRENITGDAYYTDGQRVVLFLLEEAAPTQPVRYLAWEPPAGAAR